MTPEIPSLIISEQALRPSLPRATDPDVTVWCDRRGVLGALSHCVEEEHWLHVVGVASFRLDPAANAVLAIPWNKAKPEAIIDDLQNTVWPAMFQVKGWEVLHASAVTTSSGVVAFCAMSETGKSTLAYALSHRGYCHWADDAVVLEVSPESVQAHPIPFHVRLRSATAIHFGHSQSELRGGRVRREGRHKEAAQPLRAICLLEQVTGLPDDQVVTVNEVGPGQALAAVLEHAIYFSMREQHRKRRMMEQYLTLVVQVPVFKVHMRRGLELLPTILDAIEKRVLQETS